MLKKYRDIADMGQNSGLLQIIKFAYIWIDFAIRLKYTL